MGANTKIEWATDTVNLWWGCAKISPACLHCYAETLAKLFSRGQATWGADGLRWNRAEKAFAELDSLQRIAAHTAPRRVFINSMSDTFEDRADLERPRAAFFAFVERWPDLRLLLLTKRPENIHRMVPVRWLRDWPANVWVGATVESNEQKSRVDWLLNVPARVRFLSVEPMLGPLDLNLEGLLQDVLDGSPMLHWIICGGESGPGHRELVIEHVAELREQCASAGVAFFMKQDSGSKPGQRGRIPDDLWVQEFPKA
jgi:protein gp37